MVMATELCDNLEQNNIQYSKGFLDKSTSQVGLYKFDSHLQQLPGESLNWSKLASAWKILLRHFSSPLSIGEEVKRSKKAEHPAAPTTHIPNLNTGIDTARGHQHLQTFLQSLLQRDEEKSLTSFLSLLLEINQTKLTSESDQTALQSFACGVLCRLLLACDVIRKQIRSKPDMTSLQLKPGRVAPPIPKQARPLPPPPIPEHAADEAPIMASSPPVPLRSKSLVHDLLAAGEELGLSDSIFVCSSEEEISEEESLLTNRVLSSAISHVVRKRLFIAETSPMDKFVASPPCREDTPAKQTPSSETATAPSLSSTTVVTTPDSGCGTAEDDSCPQVSSPEAPHVPKLDLRGALQDSPVNPADFVPPLDLSEIAPRDDEYPTKKQHHAPSKPHRLRDSPLHVKPSSKVSSPIDIPPIKLAGLYDNEVSPAETSPTDGSLRWRDAWSTDEETLPMSAAMENVGRRDVRYPIEEEVLELPPSSPENHVPRLHHNHHHHHHHHHHYHHKRHHHHDNQLSRPKLHNGLRRESSHEHIVESLRELLSSLEVNRKENNRPEDLTLMTRLQIRAEKMAMQRELLKHESRHGRPSTKEEKEIMRGVYERYRMVKRLLADTMSPPFNSALRRFDNFDYDVNPVQQGDDVTTQHNVTSPEGRRRSSNGIEANDHIAADLGLAELRKQLKEAKAKRKRLRRKLKEFEKEIEQQYGRAVNQTDRLLMSSEYSECHGLKLKLRLLNALIEKRSSQRH